MPAPGEESSEIGRTIAGRYRLERLLGQGAMGRVFVAQHESLRRTVAVKLLRPQYAGDQLRVRRFETEAKAASRLDHPCSVRVIDFGEDGKELYIVMEHVDAQDLQQVLDRVGRLAPDRAAGIAIEVLAALAHAHDQGVLHRDVKPGNVLVTERTDDDGRRVEAVKVCDFGLAKLLDRDPGQSGGPLTRQGAVFGTPAYMAPEQARGETPDERTDVYACGVLLYKMLTGQTPFRAERPWQVLEKHISEVPRRPSEHLPGLDVRIEEVVLRALEKKPEKRYASAREMREALRSIFVEPGLDAPTVLEAGPTLVRAPPFRAASDTVALSRDEARFTRTLASNDRVTMLPAPHRAAAWMGAVALLLALGLGLWVWSRTVAPHAPVAPSSVQRSPG